MYLFVAYDVFMMGNAPDPNVFREEAGAEHFMRNSSPICQSGRQGFWFFPVRFLIVNMCINLIV